MAFHFEGEMYHKVKEFLISNYGCEPSFTHYDKYGGVKNGQRISLHFGTAIIYPDVYGIIREEQFEIPILAEGKLHIDGHNGTKAFGQALQYKNLGMLSILFFPKEEFNKEEMNLFFSLCRQAGIGLLGVPYEGSISTDDVKLQPQGFADIDAVKEIPKIIQDTLNEIKGIGSRHIKNIYAHSIRDFVGLFGNKTQIPKIELKSRFEAKWEKGFKKVLYRRPYDPMVRKAIKNSPRAKSIDVWFKKFYHASVTLNLIHVLPYDECKLTDLGEHIKFVMKYNFTTELAPNEINIFSYITLISFGNVIHNLFKLLREKGQPTPLHSSFCLNEKCGYSHWKGNWYHPETGKKQCTKCGSEDVVLSVMQELNKRYPKNKQYSSSANIITYDQIKFINNLKITEKKVPSKFEGFSGIKIKKGNGDPIRFEFIWFGEGWCQDKKT